MRGAGRQEIERLANRGEQRHPGIGQLEAAIVAPEQRHAQVILQCFHLPADRAMGQVELLGRGAEAQAVGGDLEGG